MYILAIMGLVIIFLLAIIGITSKKENVEEEIHFAREYPEFCIYSDTTVLYKEKKPRGEKKEIPKNTVLVFRDASFPGGFQAYDKWMAYNLKYPEEARRNGVQGRVLVQFDVEKDGYITNAKILRSIDPVLDNEVLRVINAMPRWIPGYSNGETVKYTFTIPISFQMGGEVEE